MKTYEISGRDLKAAAKTLQELEELSREPGPAVLAVIDGEPAEIPDALMSALWKLAAASSRIYVLPGAWGQFVNVQADGPEKILIPPAAKERQDDPVLF